MTYRHSKDACLHGLHQHLHAVSNFKLLIFNWRDSSLFHVPSFKEKPRTDGFCIHHEFRQPKKWKIAMKQQRYYKWDFPHSHWYTPPHCKDKSKLLTRGASATSLGNLCVDGKHSDLSMLKRKADIVTSNNKHNSTSIKSTTSREQKEGRRQVMVANWTTQAWSSQFCAILIYIVSRFSTINCSKPNRCFFLIRWPLYPLPCIHWSQESLWRLWTSLRTAWGRGGGCWRKIQCKQSGAEPVSALNTNCTLWKKPVTRCVRRGP